MAESGLPVSTLMSRTTVEMYPCTYRRSGTWLADPFRRTVCVTFTMLHSTPFEELYERSHTGWEQDDQEREWRREDY